MFAKNLVRSAFALVVSFGAIGPVHAKEPIERSGNVYHEAVCSRAISRGQARCFAHVVVDAEGHPIVGRPNRPNKGGPPASSSQPPLTAPQLKLVYGLDWSGAVGTVAIVDAYGYPNALDDLNTYRTDPGNNLGALPTCSQTSGSPCFQKIDQRGGASYPTYNRSWAQEQALDLDMVSAACPQCSILLVQADSNQFSDLAAATAMAASFAEVVAVSNSYGGGESGTQAYEPAYDSDTYNHAGVAVTVSAGDSGYGVNFPASAPHVVAVGGTTLTLNAKGTRGSETVWSGTGSGCSSVYGKPAWQTDGATDGTCANRMETDVSAIADPSTGVSVFGPSPIGNGSTWLTFGGTSVGAPLIAGIYGSVGFSSAYPAQALWSAPAGSLFDVVSGANASGKRHSVGCSPTYFCTAGGGYDGPSGNGTPNGTAAF